MQFVHIIELLLFQSVASIRCNDAPLNSYRVIIPSVEVFREPLCGLTYFSIKISFGELVNELPPPFQMFVMPLALICPSS